MNISNAVEIIDRQAELDGVSVLDLLTTLEKYGVFAYIRDAGLDAEKRIEFLTAYNVFMDAGRKMFAKVEA